MTTEASSSEFTNRITKKRRRAKILGSSLRMAANKSSEK